MTELIIIYKIQQLAHKQIWHYVIVIWSVLFTGCNSGFPDNIQLTGREPVIDPVYSGVTIPPNIAPLNFVIKEEGNLFKVEITHLANDMKISLTSSNGNVNIPLKPWKALLRKSRGDTIEFNIYSYKENKEISNKYDPIRMYVANEEIDTYMSYRLLYPGYYGWSKMQIIQRSLENFREISLIENQLIENNCVNCHSFNCNSSEEFLIHIRGSKGGTYFVNGADIARRDLKIKNMPGGATYPSWHPSGKYIAFSSNKVVQDWYANKKKSIEVFDLISTLVIYEMNNNKMYFVTEPDTIKYMQTFPSWSPDGKYLYFCRARMIEEEINVENIKNVHYDLVRKAFYPESMSFGKAEMIFDASAKGKSVSFPRISPDGRHLVFTLHDFGTFPIWHKEADLYIFNLGNEQYTKMNINSDEAESYHSWSSNGKWLVFSSKRRDGLSARPYFAYFGSDKDIGKPFVLPQKNPTHYINMLKTFNIPEFNTGKIKVNTRDFARAANKQATKAISGNPDNIPSKLIDHKTKKGSDENAWRIHE